MISTVLLVIIYVSFIGLGIPDSLFGASWPAIYAEWGLPISFANYVTCLISGGTVISGLIAAKAIHRFGTGKITAFSTALTAVALLGFRLSPNVWWMCGFAVPLGLGAGAIDIGLNNYVALHYKASHMNFLHCFYGIGITVSPWLMSMALSGPRGWRGGYELIVAIQCVITVLTIIALPMWKQADPSEGEEEPSPGLFTYPALLRDRKVRIGCYMFLTSCAIEFTCGVWGSTYLVEFKNLPADKAAGLVTFYYAGIALGRLICGFVADKLGRRKVIHIGQFIVALAILILFLPLSPWVAAAGLFLVGFGNGPLYPNLLHLIPTLFGAGDSQSIMAVQMACGYVGVFAAPIIFGYLAQATSLALFAPYLAVTFLALAGSTYALHRMTRK